MKVVSVSAFTILALFTFASAAPIDSIDALTKRGSTYTGTATWYEPASDGGSEGACGGVHIDNNSPYVALNHAQLKSLVLLVALLPRLWMLAQDVAKMTLT
ncbi:hypothetical protein G6F68_020823 [Rhizopus microsporus]|nr:hypothetical protein G6F68_020823 [Rhizopus microsporus]